LAQFASIIGDYACVLPPAFLWNCQACKRVKNDSIPDIKDILESKE
jgi:hypothetical protein